MAKWRGPYSFTDSFVSLAPKESGVYKLLYKGEIVYIGSSKASLHSRLHSHRKRKTFMKVTHFTFMKTDSDKAIAVERRLCAEFAKKHGKLPRLQKAAPKESRDFIDRYLQNLGIKLKF